MTTKRKHLLAALAFLLPAAAFVATPASAATTQHKPKHHAVSMHRASIHHSVHKKTIHHANYVH